MVVSLKSELNSWTTQAEASFETSKDQVRNNTGILDGTQFTDRDPSTVKVDDILCLLESEREARRLR